MFDVNDVCKDRNSNIIGVCCRVLSFCFKYQNNKKHIKLSCEIYREICIFHVITIKQRLHKHIYEKCVFTFLKLLLFIVHVANIISK